ncbi:adenosine deaminase [Oceanomicrobium pacificus]|uniref:Adenosine deaminase n=1 Tax=Oceanomicrobium pacificus TaxID=2692916 RepID=A0A6B0TNE1_9RHOB|nr:adenosine deaminase [Oceanomicrobium pacificus]MXU66120.1 adenosine deaminase [Oceanomicrobium pacificus]
MTDWRTLPKTELHLHLEGAAPPDFIRTLAGEKGVDLSSIFDENGAYDWADFAAFLRTYEAACSVLQGPRDFKRLVEAVLATSSAHGVIYTEIFLAPSFCGGGDKGAWAEYLAAMVEGAENARASTGIETRFISTAVRHMGPEAAARDAQVTVDVPHPMLTGFGMGGEERHLTAADFARAFAIAGEAGLGLTSHAGEICGPESVGDTLDHLGVSRIGHGVRAIEDPDMVARLVDKGTVLEVNPGSNVALSVVDDWDSHPIAKLRDAGVKVTVSTDDPPYFHTDMVLEYEKLAEHFGWGLADFNAINRVAMEAAFCDEPTRQACLSRFN